MNPPGVGHEAGETARSIITALKATPGILALVIFNVLFMGMVFYIQHSNGERWQELMTLTLQQCKGTG